MCDELNKVVETAEAVKDEAQETAEAVMDEAQETVKSLKDMAREALDRTDIDEKIVEGAKDIVEKIGGLFNGKE